MPAWFPNEKKCKNAAIKLTLKSSLTLANISVGQLFFFYVGLIWKQKKPFCLYLNLVKQRERALASHLKYTSFGFTFLKLVSPTSMSVGSV